MASVNMPGAVPAGTPTPTASKPVNLKDMNDIQFIIYALKQSFVALACLRLITEKFGGSSFSNLIAAAAAIVLGTLLRHKTTRKLLPKKIAELWEPLHKIRKSRLLKLKASILIDLANYAAFFRPMLVKLVFGRAGWTPIGVFLVHYLYYSFSLAAVNFSQIWTSAVNFLPTATLGWLLENGFIEKKDLWAAVRDPAVAKAIAKAFFARLKTFAKEEKERRKMGLTDEMAYERFAMFPFTIDLSWSVNMSIATAGVVLVQEISSAAKAARKGATVVSSAAAHVPAGAKFGSPLPPAAAAQTHHGYTPGTR